MTRPLNDRPVGRLAPSPTGSLHLGNARTFLLAWLSIRQRNGILILRIEDIDTPRIKPGAVEKLVDDLRWLGLDWEFGPDCPPDRQTIHDVSTTQSQRLERYREVLQQLIDAGHIYRCRCTRKQISEAAASAPHESNWPALDGPVYPGTCRPIAGQDDTFEFSASSGMALRWAFAPGRVTWTDGIMGEQSCDPLRHLGDFVIGRSGGLPAYQLAVVVDDHDMKVTEVVRGNDLVLSTFRQLAIYNALKWPVPTHYHAPLMLDNDGRRMAKRQGDSLSYLREQGVSPEVIVGNLAHSVGLIDRNRPVRPADLIGTYNATKLHAK